MPTSLEASFGPRESGSGTRESFVLFCPANIFFCRTDFVSGDLSTMSCALYIANMTLKREREREKKERGKKR